MLEAQTFGSLELSWLMFLLLSMRHNCLGCYILLTRVSKLNLLAWGSPRICWQSTSYLRLPVTLMTSLLLFDFVVTKDLKPSGVIKESSTICQMLNGNNIQVFLALLWDRLCCMTSSVLEIPFMHFWIIPDPTHAILRLSPYFILH